VVHTDGWGHFIQGAATLSKAFADAGVDDVLIRATPGTTVKL